MRLLLCLLLLPLSLAAVAYAVPQSAADLRSVWLTAEQLPASLHGLPVSSLSVVSWHDGEFHPIPYQIDEINREGLVYFEDGPDVFHGVGSNGLFDAKDQLGFMWQDVGKQAPQDAQPEGGNIVADVSVSVAGLPPGHVYLVQGSKTRTHRRYINQNISTGVTLTPYYVLKVNPDNELDWYSLRYNGYQGTGSIVASLQMRMSGRLFFSPTITLDNSNLKPELLAVKQGLIRSVALMKIHVVLMGVPVMTIYEQISRYTARYQAVTYAVIPDLYSTVLKSPRVAVSIVGNKLRHSLLTTALHQDDPVEIDGEMSAEEKQLVKNGISNRHNWLYFDSNRNFVMMTRLAIPPRLRDVPVVLVYRDQNKMGGHAAQLPQIGYGISGWPKADVMRFGLDLLFDNTLHQMSPSAYLEQRVGTPLIKVTAL